MQKSRSFTSSLGLSLVLVACGGVEPVPLGSGEGNATQGSAGSGGTPGVTSDSGASGTGGAAGGQAGGTTAVDSGTGWVDAQPAGNLAYYATCGDVVCRVGPGTGADSGVASCGSIKTGDPCTVADAMCDPGTVCGVMLKCATGRLDKNCPISSAAFKKDINYLGAEDLEKLASTAQHIKLATYYYKDQKPEEQKHLGFIIQDDPNSPAVYTSRDKVDLYGYASMAVAALQVQNKQIAKLERELGELRAELARVKKSGEKR
jgi:hypothetical protein